MRLDPQHGFQGSRRVYSAGRASRAKQAAWYQLRDALTPKTEPDA